MYREDLGEKLMSATLTIKKAEIEGVTFDDALFVFDGGTKNIKVSGDVPNGVEIEYTIDGQPWNGAVNIGTYRVTATLSGGNFTELILSATMIIERADVAGVTFPNRVFAYDGSTRNMFVSGALPAGTSVTYTNSEGDPFSGASLPGVYSVTATITGANYNTLVLTATLTINKAIITGITFPEYSVIYDGLVHNVGISGNLPHGVSVKYVAGSEDGPEWNGASEMGVHIVFAIITGDNYHTLVLSTTLAITGGSLDQVTGVKLTEETIPSGPIGTSTVWLSWDPVANADSYMVVISFPDGRHALSVQVSDGTNFELKREVWDDIWRGDYHVAVVAMPESGSPIWAQSTPSEALPYFHEGRISSPQNVRVENGILRWDRTPYANTYEIMSIRYNNEGQVLSIDRVVWMPQSTASANNPQQAIAGLQLPPGNYRFAVRASFVAGVAIWHTGFASEPSEYTEMVVL